MAVKAQQIYYNLLLQGYMFRLLRVIIRPNEPTQDYLIPSALWDPVALTVGGVIVVSACQPYKFIRLTCTHNTVTTSIVSAAGSQSALGIN